MPEQRWAAIFAAAAPAILDIVLLPPRVSKVIARRLESMLLHEAPDPNRSRQLLSSNASNVAPHGHDSMQFNALTDHGCTNAGVSLLFPMNDLFETFVSRVMQSALAPGSTRLQHTGRYALTARDHSMFALRPDIVVDNHTVIDTKWKRLIPDDRVVGVEQSDVYQMLAYANAYEARRVVILYPWHPGLPAPGIYRRWNIAGTSIAFDIATVDVGHPDSVPTTLRDITGA